MRLFFCFLMVFSTLGCSTLSREDEEKARLYLKVGSSQLENRDYPNALKSLLEAERLNPDEPMIQNNLSLAYLMRDRLDLSETHVRKALALKPDYTEAKNNLGRLLTERGRPREALPILESAAMDLTYEKPARITLNLGIAHFKLKDYKKAREYFSKTLDFGRDNCMAQNYLGRSYYEVNDYKRASEILDLAVGFCKTSQFDEPHYFSALAYYQLGDRIKAEARLEEVLRIYSQGKYQDQAKSLLETMRK